MNRCVRATTRGVLATVCAALLLAGSAWAQALQRPFPANAWRGELVIGHPPLATLNGQSIRMAPGLRLRNPDNLLVLSATVAGQRLLVHYTLDVQGLLQDAWILSAAEAARQPWPRNALEAAALRFDSTTQTWSRP